MAVLVNRAIFKVVQKEQGAQTLCSVYTINNIDFMSKIQPILQDFMKAYQRYAVKLNTWWLCKNF